jgi:hypothetical protein
MWSSTNQRIKALMSARQRERERLTRPIHVRRADIKLSFRADDGFLVEVPARGLLNDFTPAGFSVYAVARLSPNVEVTVEVEHPKRFTLQGKIVWCQYQPSSSHVLTTQTYPYRVGLALLFKDAKVEEEFQQFCSELGNLYVHKKGLFIEEAFVDPSAAAPVPAKDPNDVPAPAVSDEGGAPRADSLVIEREAAENLSAEQVSGVAEAALAAAAEAGAGPGAGFTPTPASPGETASILDALKDIDPGTSKKAA